MQKKDINMAADLARFIAEKTSHNLFLTGKAGTGKTVFLRDFVAHTKKKVVVLAPTGIAAINANAMTIHSFCRFGVTPCPLGKFREGNDFLLEEKEEQLVREIDMIIIDEVSMVRADVMDHISEKIRLIRKSDKPFGGVQLLLIGDLYQLPPVVTKEDEAVLKGYYGRNYFFFNSKALKLVGFETVCLDKVYRQNNVEFVNILNRAREGKVSTADCDKLNSRCISDFIAPTDIEYINLVAQRNQAKEINNERLSRVEGESKVFNAKITGDFPADSYPTSKTLILKKGSQVMFVKNDKEGKYCNGTLGEIASMDDEKISVKVGEDTIEVSPVSWDNICFEHDNYSQSIQRKTIGKFVQFPLKTAWAITIHKSQGLSFEHAIIDIPRAFAAGQAYVALSRCRSLEGLVLKQEFTSDSFFADPLVSEFYEGVDNAVHISQLAEAVGFEPFEWEEKDENCQDVSDKPDTETNGLSTESNVSGLVNEIIDSVDHHIYHLCQECGEGLGTILDEIREFTKDYTSGDNPYYSLKSYKEVYKEVRKIVIRKYREGSWTLKD